MVVMNIAQNNLKEENTHTVINDLLPEPYFTEIQNIFNWEHFAWFFIDDVVLAIQLSAFARFMYKVGLRSRMIHLNRHINGYIHMCIFIDRWMDG